MFKKCIMDGWIVTVALIFMNLLFMPTCAQGAKDTMIIGMQDDTEFLDPAVAYEFVSSGIVDQLYERLVSFNTDDPSQIVPQLAESWGIGEDGKTWTFHLAQDNIFASGNPINADAVVFSLQRVMKVEADVSWLLTQFGLTESSITKIDEYTMQIVTDEQYAPGVFLACLATTLGSIVDPKVVMEHEQGGDHGSVWLEEHSAGSGPFILVERKPGEHYVLKANELYKKSSSLVKEIIIKNVQEPIEQMIMLKTGEIDIAWDLQADQVRELEFNPDIQIFEVPTFDTVYVAMNVKNEHLAKPEVRDAIRYAIDYDGIIDFILQGTARKLRTFLPEGIFDYTAAIKYDYNPEQAKGLLEEAGYPDGFTIELACFDYSPWIELAIKIKRDLAKIGVKVKIKQMAPTELFDIATGRGGELILTYWGIDYFDPDANAKPFAHSDSAGDDATIQSVAWMTNYVNVETAKLVEQAAQESDPKKRAELYQKISDDILDNGPYAFLYSPLKQYGVSAEVQDLIKVPAFFLSYFPTLN